MPESKEGLLSLRLGRAHIAPVLEAGAAVVDLLPPKMKVVGASFVIENKHYDLDEMADLEIELHLERVPQPEAPAEKKKPGPKPGAKARKTRQALGTGGPPPAEKKQEKTE